MSSDFQLQDYIREINVVAQENKVSTSEAVDMFVVNLTTMKPHYPGADNLNFHILGQQWNKLLSKQKVAQKAEVKKQVTKNTRSSRPRAIED